MAPKVPESLAEEMARMHFAFGDIIAVDDGTGKAKDDRRWMILAKASFSMNRPWLTLFVGPSAMNGTLVPRGTMHGFVRVEE